MKRLYWYLVSPAYPMPKHQIYNTEDEATRAKTTPDQLVLDSLAYQQFLVDWTRHLLKMHEDSLARAAREYRRAERQVSS